MTDEAAAVPSQRDRDCRILATINWVLPRAHDPLRQASLRCGYRGGGRMQLAGNAVHALQERAGGAGREKVELATLTINLQHGNPVEVKHCEQVRQGEARHRVRGAAQKVGWGQHGVADVVA